MAIKSKVVLADELGITPEDVDRAVAESTSDPYAEDSIEIPIDFDSKGTSDLPDGTWHARLEAVDRQMAKSGNPMVVWRFRTLKEKAAFWLYTTLSQDAMWKVTETAVACGAKGEGRQRVDISTLVGNTCRLVIKNEIYEGQMRPSVKKVLAPTQETHDLSDLG